MTDRIFISHASDDEAVVNRIVAYLEQRGASCWIASRDIPPRAIYAEEITKGIQECAACAVIVSAAANASKAVKRELELANHYDKPFIPIRIDATEPGPGLDYYLRNVQWVDYRRNGDAALDRIAPQTARQSRAATPPSPRTKPLSTFAAQAVACGLEGEWVKPARAAPSAWTATPSSAEGRASRANAQALPGQRADEGQ